MKTKLVFSFHFAMIKAECRSVPLVFLNGVGHDQKL